MTFEEYREQRSKLWHSFFRGLGDARQSLLALDSEYPEYLQKIIDYPIEDTV